VSGVISISPGAADFVMIQRFPSQSNSGLERDVPAQIGRRLKEVYEDVVTEAVPKRFADLLEKLARRNSGDP
jgi:hypothetical protein